MYHVDVRLNTNPSNEDFRKHGPKSSRTIVIMTYQCRNHDIIMTYRVTIIITIIFVTHFANIVTHGGPINDNHIRF